MKGDRVEIVIDASGSTRTYDIEATRAGRRVEVTHGRGLVEVTETTRGGTPVRRRGSWPGGSWARGAPRTGRRRRRRGHPLRPSA